MYISHRSHHTFALKFFTKPFEKKNGCNQLAKAMTLFGGLDDAFLEKKVYEDADKDFLQILCTELGSIIGGVEDDDDNWLELRTKIIIDKVFHDPRYGMCLLLIAHKDTIMNRNDNTMSFSGLGQMTYQKTLKYLLKIVGIKTLTVLFASVIWDLANRGHNKRGGGITKHPFFDDCEGHAGLLMKNNLLDEYEPRVKKWLGVLKAHGKTLATARKAYVRANRPRVRPGGAPKVRGYIKVTFLEIH